MIIYPERSIKFAFFSQILKTLLIAFFSRTIRLVCLTDKKVVIFLGLTKDFFSFQIFEEIFCPVYPEGCEDLAQDVTPSYQFSDSLPSLPTHGVFVPKPLISEPANPEHLVNLPTRKKRPSMNGRKKGIKPRRKHWKQRKRARKTKISGNSVKSRQLKPKGSVHNPNENKSMRDTKSESHSTLSTIVVNPTFFTSPPVPDAKETQIEVQTTPPPTLNDISLEDIPPTTSEKLVVVPFTSEDAAPSNARRSMEVSKQKWEETTAPSSIESEESSSLAVKAVDFASVKANSSKSSEKEAEETNSSESLTSTTVATGPVSVTLETSAKIHTTEPPTPHLQLSTYEETTGSAQISKTTTLLRGHRDEQPPNHSTQADMIEHESSTVAESSHHFEYSSGYYESGKGPRTFYDASGNFYEGSGNFYEASGGYYDVSYYENQEESSGNFNPDEHYEERRSFESKGENKMNTIGSALDIPPLPNRRVPPKQNAGNANPPDNVLKELYSIEKVISNNLKCYIPLLKHLKKSMIEVIWFGGILSSEGTIHLKTG